MLTIRELEYHRKNWQKVQALACRMAISVNDDDWTDYKVLAVKCLVFGVDAMDAARKHYARKCNRPIVWGMTYTFSERYFLGMVNGILPYPL